MNLDEFASPLRMKPTTDCANEVCGCEHHSTAAATSLTERIFLFTSAGPALHKAVRHSQRTEGLRVPVRDAWSRTESQMSGISNQMGPLLKDVFVQDLTG